MRTKDQWRAKWAMLFADLRPPYWRARQLWRYVANDN